MYNYLTQGHICRTCRVFIFSPHALKYWWKMKGILALSWKKHSSLPVLLDPLSEITVYITRLQPFLCLWRPFSLFLTLFLLSSSLSGPLIWLQQYKVSIAGAGISSSLILGVINPPNFQLHLKNTGWPGKSFGQIRTLENRNLLSTCCYERF